MSDARNCVISMTHFRRPDYTRRSLEALSKCDGIKDCLLVLHAEPDCEEVVALLRAADFCDTAVTVNPTRIRADPNTIRALDEAFSLSDFAIHVEDDVCLAPDALQYFWWARARYNDDPQVLSVAGYNRSNAPHPVEYHSVARRGWFHPWGVGLWRSRWRKHRAEILRICGVDPYTLTLNGRGIRGWDGAHGIIQQRDDLVEVHPVLSRVQNIGVVSSIHDPRSFTPEWHRVNQHVEHWAGDGRHVPAGEFRERDPGAVDVWRDESLYPGKS